MADFDNIFRKKSETTSSVPKIVLEKLNQGLPQDLEYRILDKETLILSPKGNSRITFSGIDFMLPEKYLKLLGDKQHSLELLEFYSTNTQTPIQIKPMQDNCVLVNGTVLQIDDFIKNPFDLCSVKNGALYMLPNRFAPSFNISVGDGKIEKKLIVHRVVHESLEEIKYESNDNDCLQIIYYLNMHTESMRFSFTLNTKRAKSVQELIDSITIFYAFRRGRGFIFGKEQSSQPQHDADKDTFNLKFWKHVKALEDIFNITFSIRNKKITNEVSWKLEELYQMIIAKKVIRERKTISKLFVNVGVDNNLQAGLNNQIYIEHIELQKEKLLGKELHFWLLKGIFNAKISEIKDENDVKKVTLIPYDEKQIHVSKLAFIKEDDLFNYQEINKNEYLRAFEQAKTLIEILADEDKTMNNV